MASTLIKRGLAVATAAALLAVGQGVPASSQGTPVGGTGNTYYLNDSFTGTANTVFPFGDVTDVVFFGDWDGNATDTPMLRRGNQFLIRNSNSTGVADKVVSYGDAGDVVLAGDWDGDGVDTLAVRRGNTYFFKNSISSGYADKVIAYGNPGDVVLVGDWDGDGVDTLTVRRGNQYFVKNSIATGYADSVFSYGDAGDTVLVGNWDAQDGDSLAVRRGHTYYLRNTLSTGNADVVFGYGNPEDTSFTGDWDGDGDDTLGVRRPPAQAPFGDGTHRIGVNLKPGTYRASGPNDASCHWKRLKGLNGDGDIIAQDYGMPTSIVTIAPTDVAFSASRCGTWRLVEQTFPQAPATSIADPGHHVVGEHIQPGTYTAAGGSQCYWERTRAFTGLGPNDTIDNGSGQTRPTVTIAASDAGFYTFDCGTWTRA